MREIPTEPLFLEFYYAGGMWSELGGDAPAVSGKRLAFVVSARSGPDIFTGPILLLMHWSRGAVAGAVCAAAAVTSGALPEFSAFSHLE